MNKLSDIFSKHREIILIPLFSILIFLLGFYLYQMFFGYYITAKFAESGPLYIDMPVYYKGYNIGETKKIKPSKDYKYTLVKIILYPRDLKLPENVVAKAKTHHDKRDYIELLVLDQPSDVLLEKGSVIDGFPAFDLEGFLSDIADADIIVPLLQNFSDTVVSFGKTSSEVDDFFSDSRSVLKENRQNLKQATKDLAVTTKSLKKLTSRINDSISDEKINNTTSSVEKSSTNILTASENIKNITESIDDATKNLDKTVAKIDCTLSDVKAITSDAKVITSGFREVLQKRFAGLRILFGKTVNNKKCPRNCSK